MAISGSPAVSSRIRLSVLTASSESRCSSASTPARVREVEHRVAAGAELHALVDRGQEAAAPVRIAAAGPFLARAEDDEAGQVLRLAAQAIAGPGPDARPAEDRRAGAHHDLAGRMVEGVGDHRLDDRDVVDDRRQVRQAARTARRRTGRAWRT